MFFWKCKKSQIERANRNTYMYNVVILEYNVEQAAEQSNMAIGVLRLNFQFEYTVILIYDDLCISDYSLGLRFF